MEKNLRILFMEHAVPIRERMAELIQEDISGADIHFADRPQEAIAILTDVQPAVLFLDINFRLPALPEFITEAKALLPGLQVVLMYNQRNELLLENCRKAGADAFMDKYEQFDQVVYLIFELTKNRK